MVSTSLLYILLDASFYKNNNATTSWLAICHSVISVCYPSLHYCHFYASPSSYNLLFTLIFYLWIHLFKECLTSQWHTPEKLSHVVASHYWIYVPNYILFTDNLFNNLLLSWFFLFHNLFEKCIPLFCFSFTATLYW